MPLVKATVQFPYRTGLPQDVATNTFWFQAANESGWEVALHNALVSFWNSESGSGNIPIATFYSSYIDRDQCSIRYAFVDPATGAETSSAVIVPWVLGDASNTTDLPLECAATFTIRQNAPGSTAIPEARRRGRLFLGPFNSLANSGAEPDGVAPLIASNLINRVVNEAAALVGETNAIDVRWCVYSRRNRVAYLLTDGWMDNEWDTIRSRGAVATNRTPAFLPVLGDGPGVP